MIYSFVELTDMHFCYELSNSNNIKAATLYMGRFPNRRHPDRRMFMNIHMRLRQLGNLKPNHGGGRRATVTTIQRKEKILETIEENPSIRARRNAAMERVSHMTVHCILRTNVLYPYHLQRIQAMNPEDAVPRIRLCEWFTWKCIRNPLFHSSVLFTNELGFNRNGIINFHNNHL